jgi:hypothetical protein
VHEHGCVQPQREQVSPREYPVHEQGIVQPQLRHVNIDDSLVLRPAYKAQSANIATNV